jgi:hypothetical protein
MPSKMSYLMIGYKFHFRIFGRILGRSFSMNQIPKNVRLCNYILKILINIAKILGNDENKKKLNLK